MIEDWEAPLSTPANRSVDARSSSSMHRRSETSRKMQHTYVRRLSFHVEIESSVRKVDPSDRMAKISTGRRGGSIRPSASAENMRAYSSSCPPGIIDQMVAP